MDPGPRARFNAAWTPALAEGVRAELEERLSCRIGFPLAETPLFFPPDAWERFSRAAHEILALLPRDGGLPQFAQVDFAVTEGLEPKLVELQGFPSLYAFQHVLAEAWARRVDGGPWTHGFTRDPIGLLRRAVLGEHDPREVVLLDLDPRSQKTYPDFAASRVLLGVDAVDPSELSVRGGRLYRDSTRVRRVYQRIVPDELERSGRTFSFDGLDVEWAPHPDWYFRWSKDCLLSLLHPAVPRAWRLSELPAGFDPAGCVLKPLYSFAGGGVNVEPTRADVDAVPGAQRESWILQEKIDYAPALMTPDGAGVKAEVRMMFVRPDDEPDLILHSNLVRLSRGKMMGVDFNKGYTWVGSSVGLRRAIT